MRWRSGAVAVSLLGTTISRQQQVATVSDAVGAVVELDYDATDNVTRTRRYVDVSTSGASLVAEMAHDELDRMRLQTVAPGTADEMVTSIGFAEGGGGGGCSCSANPHSGLPHRIVDPCVALILLTLTGG